MSTKQHLTLSKKSGFTLIELSFAVAFISILVITITLIANEIISLYRKGYAIKAINQVGSDFIEDLNESIKSSPPSNLAGFCDRYQEDSQAAKNCEKNNGIFSVYQQYYAQVLIDDRSERDPVAQNVPIGGVFCTGKYTYVWNTGYLFGEQYSSQSGEPLLNRSLQVRYKVNDVEKTMTNFRLIKFEDPTRSTCMSNIYSPTNSSITYPDPANYLTPPRLSGSADSSSGFDISSPLSEDPKEFLSESDTALALYDFVVFPPAQDDTTNKLFYSGSFILGTINGGVNVMSSSNFCESPNTFNADFSYCAINKFNFGTQASGV